MTIPKFVRGLPVDGRGGSKVGEIGGCGREFIPKGDGSVAG